jgi:hypothetical protein
MVYLQIHGQTVVIEKLKFFNFIFRYQTYFIVGKRRKEEGGFPGADIILKQIKDKPKQRRVGFTSSGPPARGNYDCLS